MVFKLRGNLPLGESFDVRLGDLHVTTEALLELQDHHWRRTIEGNIKEKTPDWNTFLTEWSELDSVQQGIDGRQYFPVRNLQIDYDHYGLASWLYVEDDSVIIIAQERFDGTEDEFRAAIQTRNHEKRELEQRWDEGRVTCNDLRILCGLGETEDSVGSTTLSVNQLAHARNCFFDGLNGFGYRTNLLV